MSLSDDVGGSRVSEAGCDWLRAGWVWWGGCGGVKSLSFLLPSWFVAIRDCDGSLAACNSELGLPRVPFPTICHPSGMD